MNNKRNKVGKQNLRIDLYKVAKNSKVVRKQQYNKIQLEAHKHSKVTRAMWSDGSQTNYKFGEGFVITKQMIVLL